MVRGEPELAIREAERALALHRELDDPVRETEDLRILAVALSRAGRPREADTMFREVIDRATKHDRPLLVANAQRDLGHLLAREGRVTAAKEMAHAARATFNRLGAKVEAERLDALFGEPDVLRSGADRGQEGSPPNASKGDAGIRARAPSPTEREMQS